MVAEQRLGGFLAWYAGASALRKRTWYTVVREVDGERIWVDGGRARGGGRRYTFTPTGPVFAYGGEHAAPADSGGAQCWPWCGTLPPGGRSVVKGSAVVNNQRVLRGDMAEGRGGELVCTLRGGVLQGRGRRRRGIILPANEDGLGCRQQTACDTDACWVTGTMKRRSATKDTPPAARRGTRHGLVEQQADERPRCPGPGHGIAADRHAASRRVQTPLQGRSRTPALGICREPHQHPLLDQHRPHAQAPDAGVCAQDGRRPGLARHSSCPRAGLPSSIPSSMPAVAGHRDAIGLSTARRLPLQVIGVVPVPSP
ncbi:hypothetical protein P154DRAFT_244156 [Amniculicola lignicola CBS 123094]|uniref:Uncharacterized protein n=1 Tax=Amniculicola lignicola CBS 123094 TaxID=1392246 RepID=A0A6A5WCC4_9PLEO|nr:hypothetical protein P154DRAFT_244156 [Amniculicola lignicola CBS 123094]